MNRDETQKPIGFLGFGVWGKAPNSQGESLRLSPNQNRFAEKIFPEFCEAKLPSSTRFAR
jgi:hypothetical protein